ncbi:GspH/FimT family pseudopilin [Luteimonas sp. MC1828]|uniref:GspH/FimT family pseudopilin n=1 Tax=Luteimonas sp. MC1828 TaxID=2799787 RepID=UPI0018F1D26B|nr:GspH/FimT family pseudopilin [Luteimonas sp. MC1828]MBJ7574799.1 GspH/FimT family pseudopilin [Luteimonas sp. MC1828]
MPSTTGSGMSISRTGVAAPRPESGTLVSAQGFTLVELMVTMAVVGILAAVAAPSMTALINGNRLAGASGELTASLQLARSEALRRSSPVTICGTTDGVACSADWTRWIVVGTNNINNAVDVVRDSTVSGAVQVQGPAGGIVFQSSGLIDAQGQLNVCVPTDSPDENQRVITVLISGNIVTGRVNGGGLCP